MGSTTAVALFLLLAAVPAVFAVTFQVGDASGWASGVDYETWATGKTFRVGDTLDFQYGPSHSVAVVDKAGYDNCDGSSLSQSFSDGDTKIVLRTVGTMHFLCLTPGHCQGGMKLAVPVLAAVPAPATPSSPPPPRSPPPSSPRSPPPSTPSSPPPSTPSPPPSPRSPPPSTPSPKSPPSSTPSPPLAPRSPPRKPKTPPPSASPPANGKPKSESPTSSPSPSPSTSSPSQSANAATKGVMSYGMIGVTMVLMFGLMS